jgi:hypothetical protein
MSPALKLADIALRVDELLQEPGNFATAREFAHRYLDGRVQESIPALPLPLHPDDFDRDDERIVLSSEQLAAAFGALHEVYCPNVPRVVERPPEEEQQIYFSDEPDLPPDATVANEATLVALRRSLAWVATLNRVRRLGEHAVPWFRLQLPRFEKILNANARPPKRSRRRRTGEMKITPLTEKQVEAVQLIGEHKGNIAAAARSAGKSPAAMKKLYDKANRKLGKKAIEKIKTQRLPKDQRGQAMVADPHAEDPNAKERE